MTRPDSRVRSRRRRCRSRFGFYHHQRDEEAIVDSSTNLPSTLHGHALADEGSRGGGGGDSSGLPASVIPSIDGSGHATPVTAVHPKSYSQYRRNLKEAFKGFRRPKEEGSRTVCLPGSRSFSVWGRVGGSGKLLTRVIRFRTAHAQPLRAVDSVASARQDDESDAEGAG